jgi:molybdate transport system ATP-binding protein
MGLTVQLKKTVKGFELEVAFEIGNELAVLFGPSGSGKSMTLRMIGGLLPPDAGFIRLDGIDLYDAKQRIIRPPQARGLGYVFQNHSLFPHMTVLRNIMFGARKLPQPQQKETAEQMLTTFRLEGLANKYPHEISGGQQQRVAFARAIIRKPKALLLDEPFSALDTPTRVNMRACLKQVMKDLAIPILLVTHDIFEAYAMADRMLIYEQGRVIQIGSPDEIMAQPSCEAVAALTSFDYYRAVMKFPV